MAEFLDWKNCDINEIIPNDNLRNELNIGRDKLFNDNFDIVMVIDGEEGTGKSTLARQCAAYFARLVGVDFTTDNIHYELKSYMKNCKYYSDNRIVGGICVLDESRSTLNNRDSMTKGAKYFCNYLSESRAFRFIHILCLPAIHDIDKYVRTWRTPVVIHTKFKMVHTDDPKYLGGLRTERGYGYIYSRDEILPHLMNPQKYGYYSYPDKGKHFSFPATEVLSNIEEYNEKKRNAINMKYLMGEEDEAYMSSGIGGTNGGQWAELIASSFRGADDEGTIRKDKGFDELDALMRFGKRGG